jgi:hypothetical protein
MNVRFKFPFFCLLLLLFALPGISQSNLLSSRDVSKIHIDDLSDAEIEMYFTKAKESGVSEENIYKIFT